MRCVHETDIWTFDLVLIWNKHINVRGDYAEK